MDEQDDELDDEDVSGDAAIHAIDGCSAYPGAGWDNVTSCNELGPSDDTTGTGAEVVEFPTGDYCIGASCWHTALGILSRLVWFLISSHLCPSYTQNSDR